MKNLASPFRADASAKNLLIEIETKGKDFTLCADRYKLKQAVSNILSNALRYTPTSGKVIIELYKEDGMVCISFEDSGEGISPGEREKVFERFYRTDRGRNRSDGGSGLGLSVAMQIVKMHGGDIRIEEARKLTGARVILSIPSMGETERAGLYA
ncbi:MAG: sensor histidine kinase [Spirochaetaceae bacterium]